MPGRKIIRGYGALSAKLGGRSRRQIYRDIRDGKFPPPLELGPNSVGWYEDEIDKHLAAQPRRTYAAENRPAA